MAKFAIGDIVFVNSRYHVAEKCKVENLNSEDNVYDVKSIDNFGSFSTKEDKMFETKDRAFEAYEKKCAELIKSYKEGIKDLRDLLMFPLRHCFNGEEYTEFEARQAYILRVTELTGIDLAQE